VEESAGLDKLHFSEKVRVIIVRCQDRIQTLCQNIMDVFITKITKNVIKMDFVRIGTDPLNFQTPIEGYQVSHSLNRITLTKIDS
jgi:hypothetical protein